MIDVKTVADDDELRATHSLFRGALHAPPADDAGWAHVRGGFLPGRTFGGYLGGTLAGCTMSFPMRMAVPGGALLPSAAVTRVGVRADFTRRGVLTALMREQLTAIAADGEPLASLRASQYPIYGRFGYGVATRGMDLTVDPRRARPHPGAPPRGDLRLVPKAELSAVLPGVYDRIGVHRPGMLERTSDWWAVNLDRPGDTGHAVAAVHTGPGGDDGYVYYRPEENHTEDDPWGTALRVADLHAANPAALAALWRYLLGVDMTNLVGAMLRPLDEPVDLLLADPRVVARRSVGDEAWLRLVDVPAALTARSWAGSEAVTVAVRDELLPANAGTYRVSPDGVGRTDDEPALTCDVSVLARLYLGDVTPSALAHTGWLTARDPAVLPTADRLFATGVVPWSGTFF
ncbi:MAG TPA: GNAT family N-acetyltransferase [Pseudonocardiaceae bacterium]